MDSDTGESKQSGALTPSDYGSGTGTGGTTDTEGAASGKKDAEAHPPLLVEEKESFASKLSYILVLVGYAVGFGNIWRFPYLMKENGGVVFLIPFIFCMIFLGIPTFFLELAIGQRLRKSAMHAWNEVSPYWSGVGVASGGACLIVGYYYTTLIAWCLYYFFSSFQTPLPWGTCMQAEPSCCENRTSDKCKQCEFTGPSSHFWFHGVIGTSSSIEEAGAFNWGIFGALFLAWFITWAILVRGIKASGQVAYVTALLPYVVLVIFLGRSLALPGMAVGYEVMFTPNWTKLASADIWFTAGSQVFFNFGLGFGLLVSFSSLLPANNNCYRDAIYVSIINFLTSLLASSVIFPTLGYRATKDFAKCSANSTNWTPANNYNWSSKRNLTYTAADLSISRTKELIVWTFTNGKRTNDDPICDLKGFVQSTVGGTGLIFIAYADAIASFEYPQFWAVLFFIMILTLGIDSGFTTVEGAIMMIRDWNFFNLNLKKWKITTGLCAFLWVMSVIFAFGWSEYMLTFIDEFTTNWCLLLVGFFECVGVAWIYGIKRFSYDIYLMTGHKPNMFMMLCWKYISPVLNFMLFFATIITYFTKEDSLKYEVYNHQTGKKEKVRWPGYAVGIGFVFTVLAILPVPLFALLAKLKIYPVKPQPPGEFPEEELRAERNITDAELYGPETCMQKFLYWGTSRNVGPRGANPAQDLDVDAYAKYVGSDSAATTPAPSEPAASTPEKV